MITSDTIPSLEQLSAKPWWTTDDVAAYLTHLRNKHCTRNAAKIWMTRNNIRRSKADRRLTCREFVDAALNRK